MLSVLKNLSLLGILLYLWFKKYGKWRLVKDLRAVNKVFKSMVPLKSGIPLPSMFPKVWPLTVID